MMAYVHPSNPIPTAAQEIRIPIPTDERLRQAFHKLEDDHKEVSTKIHRFPASLLREFCKDRGYIAPKVVAVGPYHHGRPELQEMEEVKKAAAHNFCNHLNQPLEVVYEKVSAIAGEARRCYDSSALDGVISDAAFASMMFYDGCFLLVTMAAFTENKWCDPVLRNHVNTSMVARDIFLLENQIPWLVLQTLKITAEVELSSFLGMMEMGMQSRFDDQARSWVIGSHEPPHLLGLYHFYQSGSVEKPKNLPIKSEPNYPAYSHDLPTTTDRPQSARGTVARVKYFFLEIASSTCRHWQHTRAQQPRRPKSYALGTSAIELAEIGVKLTTSETAEFSDIGLTKNTLFPELFLPPLYLNQTTASLLLNMAAFEVCTHKVNSDYSVNSYLTVLAELMDREEDVHELRAKQIIKGGFSNQQMLKFFKGRLSPNFSNGQSYIRVLLSLEEYKKRGRLWIPIHRFFYHNISTIVKGLSVVGVLVGISRLFLFFNQP